MFLDCWLPIFAIFYHVKLNSRTSLSKCSQTFTCIKIFCKRCKFWNTTQELNSGEIGRCPGCLFGLTILFLFSSCFLQRQLGRMWSFYGHFQLPFCRLHLFQVHDLPGNQRGLQSYQITNISFSWHHLKNTQMPDF